jgi:hypothetical protein
MLMILNLLPLANATKKPNGIDKRMVRANISNTVTVASSMFGSR